MSINFFQLKSTADSSYIIKIIFTVGFLSSYCSAQLCFGLPNPLACSFLQGTCTATDVCSCVAGWTGPTCATAICLGAIDPVACNSAQGTCTAPDVCTCAAGWTGPTCATPTCFGVADPTACSGANGVCVGPDTCSCIAGWTGSTCATPTCFGVTDPVACSGAQGTCTAPDTCSCIAGWTGSTCATAICFGATDPVACNSAQGTCTAPDVCTCAAGWTGPTCSTPVCFGLTEPTACTGANGVCVGPDSCSCVAGWSGSDCSIPACFGFVEPAACTGVNGVCTAPDVCTCAVGWTGVQCEIPICFGSTEPTACSGTNGVCTAPDVCTCNFGWTGTICSIPECAGLVDPPACSGAQGTCTAPGVCTCAVGFTLPDCSGFFCFGILSTSTTVCSSTGVCTGVDTCVCNTGYGGPDCSIVTCGGILATSPTACSGNGVCTLPNNCVCDPGFEGPLCATVIRPPPVLCIVDNTFSTSHPDFGYIYFLTLSSAVSGCRAQPIEHIRVTSQTVIDTPVLFTRNNANQKELFIEPLTPGVGDPIIIGVNHRLTTTFEKITITGVDFMSLDFPGGAVSSPGTNFEAIIKGPANQLIFSDITFQSMPFPTAIQSPTNEPNIDYLIITSVSGNSSITSVNLYGSRKNGIEITDSTSASPITVNTITISNVIGQGNWDNFIYAAGVHSISLTSSTCIVLCGGIFTGTRAGIIEVNYKPTVSPGVTMSSEISLNSVRINIPGSQINSAPSLSGFYLSGSGTSTTSASNFDTFLIRDNVADGYPNGLRISGISDDLLKVNYPPGYVPISFDSREALRETARLNSVNLPTIGDFQGITYDVINSVASLDPFVTTSQICNDFCIPTDLCCDVNTQFTAATPGFGTIRFASVDDAIVNRPGGCNITQTITRCVRLTRGTGIGQTDPWAHTEDVFFDTEENLILISEVNPINNARVRLIGNHIFERGLNHTITIRDIRFQPTVTTTPILETNPVGALAMLYNLDIQNIYVAPGNLTTDIATGGALNLIEMSGNVISIRDSIFKPNLASPNTPAVNSEFRDTVSSDCGIFLMNDNIIEQAKDNAVSVINPSQINFQGNQLLECGAVATATTTVTHFACVYIMACTSFPPLSTPLITGNTFTGASTLQLQDQITAYTDFISSSTFNVKYTMLWLDTATQVSTGVVNPYLQNISSNSYSGIVPVRERINGVQFIFLVTIAQVERTAIRSLNLANSGDSSCQDTMFNLNDVNIEQSPGTTLIFYCTDGCPEVNFLFTQRLIIIIAVIFFIILCVIICIVGAFEIFDWDSNKRIIKDYKYEKRISELKLKQI